VEGVNDFMQRLIDLMTGVDNLSNWTWRCHWPGTGVSMTAFDP